MKKLLVLFVTIMVIGVGSANAQAVWGARVGLSRPTMSVSASSNYGVKDKNNIDGVFGLELGPVLYYSLKDNWYINSGAMFSVKKFEFGADNGDLSLYYLDIPLYAGYKFPIGSLSFYAQAGPFLGFKLAENVPGGGDSGINSFNAGLGIMTGINLNRFKVELGYQAGLVNAYSYSDSEDGYSYSESGKLSSLFLGVSYVF